MSGLYPCTCARDKVIGLCLSFTFGTKITNLGDLGIRATHKLVNQFELAKKFALVLLKWYSIAHGCHKQCLFVSYLCHPHNYRAIYNHGWC